jgi:histidinol-phosphate aminotransferase
MLNPSERGFKMLNARSAIRNLKEYHPPLAGRNGLRLDFNENTLGASPRVLASLRELDAERLACYPEREPVERLAAQFLGVLPEETLLTNGVDEAIHLLCQTYLEAGDQALVVVPTFAMYELSAASTGAEVISVPACSEFSFPTENLLEHINPATRLIAIANPNNPTGAVAASEDLLRVSRAAPEAAVLVDEAYFDFYGKTVLREIRTQPNLFVARTFAKAYGLAGLRVGVLVGDAQQIKMIRRAASPYNVSVVALKCLPAAIEDQDFIDGYVAEVRRGRERLEATFRTLGIRHWPSQANFVLAYFGPNAQRFVETMARHGILVRDRSNDHGCAGCIRITVGTEEQMDRLLAALEDVVCAMEIAAGSSV